MTISDESGNLRGGDEVSAGRLELGRRNMGKGGDLHADEHYYWAMGVAMLSATVPL